MTRTFLTRILTGTVALALLALAATGAAGTAHADDPIVITPTTPTTIGPASAGGIVVGPPLALPDLVVKFEKVSCSPYQEGGVHLLFQVRIINMANVPAQGTWQTDIKLDGVPVAGSPKVTNGPLFATILYSFNVPSMTPGLHVLTAFTDSTLMVPESNDTNNTAMARIYCPAS